jgi:hypothetical protein
MFLEHGLECNIWDSSTHIRNHYWRFLSGVLSDILTNVVSESSGDIPSSSCEAEPYGLEISGEVACAKLSSTEQPAALYACAQAVLL